MAQARIAEQDALIRELQAAKDELAQKERELEDMRRMLRVSFFFVVLGNFKKISKEVSWNLCIIRV